MKAKHQRSIARWSSLIVWCCVTIILLGCSTAHAERRVALVVGNGAYMHSTRLQNPVNDAHDISEALKRLDFEVIEGVDLGTDKFDAAVQTFATKLLGADLAVFYYSGHGLQFDGANYLVPVDTKIESTYALKKKAVVAQDVVDMMDRGAKASLMFLDACRNNSLVRELEQSLPEQKRSGTSARGLARMEPAGNSLIAFAAAPNAVASDGAGQRNSPFTTAILKHIATPDIVVLQMLTEVTAEVSRTSQNQQRPEILSRLTSQVRLNPTNVAAAAANPIPLPTQAPTVLPSKEREASIAWESVQNSCDSDRLAVFRERYGDTFFGDLAKRRLDAIASARLCTVPILTSPETIKPPPAAKVDSEDPIFIREWQSALQKVGCFKGDVDGKWGRGTRAATEEYFKSSKQMGSTDVPDRAMLARLQNYSSKVCSVDCDSDEVRENGKCVPKPPTVTMDKRPGVVVAVPHKTEQKADRQKVSGQSSAACQYRYSNSSSCSDTWGSCTNSGGTGAGCRAAYNECLVTGRWVYRNGSGPCYDWGSRSKN